MSGASRVEIQALLNEWQVILLQCYPGCDPNQICAVSAELTRQLKTTYGPPSPHLRDLGRMLKGHIDSADRSHYNYNHSTLLATHKLYSDTGNLSLAKKRARLEVDRASTDKSHWLNALTPDVQQLMAHEPPAHVSLGTLVREAIAERTQKVAEPS